MKNGYYVLVSKEEMWDGYEDIEKTKLEETKVTPAKDTKMIQRRKASNSSFSSFVSGNMSCGSNDHDFNEKLQELSGPKRTVEQERMIKHKIMTDKWLGKEVEKLPET